MSGGENALGMQRAIGLVGGTGWPSTMLYYEMLNRLAEPDTVPIVISSLSFQPILNAAKKGQMDEIKLLFAQEAKKLEAAGVGVIGLCAATAHMAFELCEASVSVPLIHIASPLGKESCGIPAKSKVGLLGTQQTLNSSLFGAPLKERQIDIVLPSPELLSQLDDAIKGPIASGNADAGAISKVQNALDYLLNEGVSHVILGCTELPLICAELSAEVPLIDVVRLHCQELLLHSSSIDQFDSNKVE